MREIRRVIKDDGTLFFCEHGIAPDLKTKNWQNRINPIWKRLMGGCNINRDIPEIISNSKLEIVDLETMFFQVRLELRVLIIGEQQEPIRYNKSDICK